MKCKNQLYLYVIILLVAVIFFAIGRSTQYSSDNSELQSRLIPQYNAQCAENIKTEVNNCNTHWETQPKQVQQVPMIIPQTTHCSTVPNFAGGSYTNCY